MRSIITILLALLISTTAAMAAVTIKLRGDTAANWTSNNPVLALREPGVETDTSKIKIGDGVTAWASLPYSAGGTVDLSAPGPIGATTPSTGAFTTLTASSFDTSPPATGETGEIGLQEDPTNGTNTVTIKAPAAMAADLIYTLPNAYAAAADYAIVGNGSGILSFVQVLLPGNIGTTVQGYDADLADLADGSLTGTKVDLSANTGTIYTSGSLYGRAPIIAKTATATLTAQECSGGIITNTGATGPIVLTLPTMSNGMRCTILVTAAYDVDVNPQDAQQILLKTDAVGNAVSSDATVGSYLTLTAVSAGWMPIGGERGTWTDVN